MLRFKRFKRSDCNPLLGERAPKSIELHSTVTRLRRLLSPPQFERNLASDDYRPFSHVRDWFLRITARSEVLLPEGYPALLVCSTELTKAIDISARPNKTMASTAMAPNPQSTPGGVPHELKMPMPPPLLHTHSGNELYDRPHTPTTPGFTSPFSTPQGSPSKNKLPPGANELPNVFDNAMKLAPTSPTKSGRPQLTAHSPNKGSKQTLDENALLQSCSSALVSPTRKYNKENTSPGVRLPQDASYASNQAAVSRQEPYQARDSQEDTSRSRYSPQRGLSPDELEKLQLPKVKRLANVTQLCMSIASINLWYC